MALDPNGIRQLKTTTCPSLSGKSKLTFEVGCDEASSIYVRISKNSGTGYFSKDWITWDRVLKLLRTLAGTPVTSYSLRPLYEGLSVNTAGFLLAALLKEGLVQPMESKPRCYECLDPSKFVKEVTALAGSSGAKAKARTPAARKKAKG